MNNFSKILKFSGGLFLFFGIVGGILGMFNYALVVNHQDMPLVNLPMAGILTGIGAVLLVAAILLGRKFKAQEPAPVQLDLGNLAFIARAMKKTRRRNVIIGIFLFLFGLGMIALNYLPDQEDIGRGGVIFLWIFGFICLLLSFLMLYQAFKWGRIEDSTIYRVILHEPETITALDVLILRSGVGKVGQAINASLKKGPKNLCTLSVNETELELLKQYLTKHNSDIVIGTKRQ